MHADILKIAPFDLENRFPTFTHAEFAQLLAEINFLTDSGQRLNARILMAKSFKFHKTEKVFISLLEVTNMRGTSALLSELIDHETGHMLSILQDFYGQYVYMKMNKTLQG